MANATITTESSTALLSEADVVLLLKRAYAYAKPDAHPTVDLPLDATLEGLGINSIAALEMTGYVEEELDIFLRDDEIASLRHLGDLAKLILCKANRVTSS
jgi:acyl carrier protein